MQIFMPAVPLTALALLPDIPMGHSTTPVEWRGRVCSSSREGLLIRIGSILPQRVDEDEWLTFHVESLAVDLSRGERERERGSVSLRLSEPDDTREMAGCVFAPAYVSIQFS